MDYISIIGTTGSTLTTVCQIPQLVKIWKTRHTKDLSLATYLVLSLGVAIWIVYGILLKAPPVYISNIATFILVFSIVIFKIRYG
jgi:MtN3 and saliva related transmembrane protein